MIDPKIGNQENPVLLHNQLSIPHGKAYNDSQSTTASYFTSDNDNKGKIFTFQEFGNIYCWIMNPPV